MRCIFAILETALGTPQGISVVIGFVLRVNRAPAELGAIELGIPVAKENNKANYEHTPLTLNLPKAAPAYTGSINTILII